MVHLSCRLSAFPVSVCSVGFGLCLSTLTATKSHRRLSRASALVCVVLPSCPDRVTFTDDRSQSTVNVDTFWEQIAVDLLIAGRFNSALRVLESNELAPFMGSLTRRSTGELRRTCCFAGLNAARCCRVDEQRARVKVISIRGRRRLCSRCKRV